MKINKNAMAARAAQAAALAPSIKDRFAHAREFASNNPASAEPVDEQPVQFRSAPVPMSVEMPRTASGSVGGSLPRWETKMVPLDLIDPNPFNARKIYRTERVNEIAASIGAHEQEVPGLATIRDGRYVLAAGHYRYRALRTLGNRPMLLTIHPDLTDRELYEMSYRENAEREGQTALDNALSWEALLTEGVYGSETEIAEATGISLPNVNKIMAALKLSESTLNLVREQPASFAFSVLYELVLFEAAAGSEQALILAKGILAGEVSRRDLQLARERYSKPTAARKRKETARTYKIQQDGVAVGSLKTWDSGKVSFEVILKDQQERQALILELQQRFGLKE